jgi:hypothetical protein
MLGCVVLSVALFLSLISPAFAQVGTTPDDSRRASESGDAPDEAKQRAARLLKSASKSARAWGAYLSARYELTENAPALVEMLEKTTRDEDGSDESVYLVRVLLDALIQLDAEAPAAALQTLYTRHPDETVILLSRSPGDNQSTLLALMSETSPYRVRWHALGNLLAQARAPGFAAMLVREMQVKATITIFSESGIGYGSNGCGGGGYGRSFCSTLEGFPPVGGYLLTDYAGRGSRVLVGGKRTIYFQRYPNLCPGEDNTVGVSGNPNRHRQEYLLSMLQISPDEIEFDVEPQFELVWINSRQYARDVRRLRAKVRRDYGELLERLQQSELLNADEAATLDAPNLTFEILDFRTEPNAPLPEVSDDATRAAP